MRPFLKHLAIAIVIFLALSGLFTFLTTPQEEPESISLSTLASKINEGAVTAITVEESDITIELTDGTTQVSRKENDASLTETLRNLGVAQLNLNEVELAVKEPSGAKVILLNLLPFLIPFIFIGLILWIMMRQAQRGNMQAMSFGQARAKLANPFAKKKITFENVAGAKEAKEELVEIVDFLKEPKKFIEIGAQIPRGVLMMGPPGTGKTLLARAISGEANVPFFYISGSDFVEMFVGVGASRVRDLFETAKKNAPSIIFVDELDAVGRHRGAGLGGGHDEREQTLNQILVEMDGFEKDSNVIVVAATNRPDILDPALLRPGRFDRRVTLDLPDIKDRLAILELHAKEIKMADDISMDVISQRTPGFSGADLANLLNEGALLAARRGKKKVGQDELLESVERVLLGPERKSHVLNPNERKIAAYHEGGHAIVAARLPASDPVHKISIVSRGKAGGFTLKLPTEDRHFHSRSQFIADLAVAMGGYAAEEIIFDELTTGASNDLERATQLARNLVTRFGMSKKLGPVTFGEKDEMVFLGKDLGETRNYSEEIASVIDNEVRDLMKDAHKTALRILKKDRDLLESIASVLLERETIEQEEFEQLAGIPASANTLSKPKGALSNFLESIPGIGKKAASSLHAAGLATAESIATASLEALTAVEGIGKATAQKIMNEAQRQSGKKPPSSPVRVQVQPE